MIKHFFFCRMNIYWRKIYILFVTNIFFVKIYFWNEIYIFYIFSYIFLCTKSFLSVKKFFIIKLFFHIKTFFSANNVYFVKNTNIFFKKKFFFFQLSFATNEQPCLVCSVHFSPWFFHLGKCLRNEHCLDYSCSSFFKSRSLKKAGSPW